MAGAILVFGLLSVGPVGIVVIYHLALWVQGRFRMSLRTLLITTTFLSVLLGLIVCAVTYIRAH